MRQLALVPIFAMIATVALILATGIGYAQNAATPSSDAAKVSVPADFNQPPAKPNGEPKPELQQPGSITINGVRYYLTTKTPYEYHLAIMTIVIGIAAMLTICWLFRGHVEEKSEDIVKLFAFVVVVFAAMFLIAVGYNDSQTAPVYSLLGTIIGYLFGRELTLRQTKPGSNVGTTNDTTQAANQPPP